MAVSNTTVIYSGISTLEITGNFITLAEITLVFEP